MKHVHILDKTNRHQAQTRVVDEGRKCAMHHHRNHREEAEINFLIKKFLIYKIGTT